MKKVLLFFLGVLILVSTTAFLNNTESEANFLDSKFIEIENYFNDKDIFNFEVSEGGVGWHLDHMLKVINNVSQKVIKSNPDDYVSNFNLRRVFVHTTGYIPRGAAQASKQVTPPDVVLMDSLQYQLKLARQNLKKLSDLEENAHFEHPIFEDLNRDQARRFIEIHTDHHLKIIKDIISQ